jgi:hypothetical protein
MKLLDDPKIPIARRNPQRPTHSHKLLDVAVEMGLKARRPYCTRRRHMSAVPTNFDPNNKERSPQNRGRNAPTDEDRDPSRLHGLKDTKAICGGAGGRQIGSDRV